MDFVEHIPGTFSFQFSFVPFSEIRGTHEILRNFSEKKNNFKEDLDINYLQQKRESRINQIYNSPLAMRQRVGMG